MIVLPPKDDLQSQPASNLVLSRLATSKVVAQVCLDDEGFVKKLARNFLQKVARIESANADSSDIVCSLQGIANFAHVSKLFRQEMQAIYMNLLPAVRKLFFEYDSSNLSEEEVYASREALAKLIETLALSADSRVWMIDTDYLRVLTELFRFDRPAKNEKATVIIRCAYALLRLLESQECLQKMRESDVLSLLKSYSGLLDNRRPGLWSHIEKKLLDDAYSTSEQVLPVWKTLRS